MTTMQAATDIVARLHANLDKLSVRDALFAESLLAAWYGKRASGKQWEWLVRLADKATMPQAEQVQSVSLWNICKMFSTAIGAFKRPPSLKLSFEKVGRVKIAFCGPRSRYHGSFNVTDGRPFGDNIFYGRIDADGTFRPSHNATPDLIAALVAFNADPAATAAKVGHETGSCMFCSRDLTDSRSVTVGYGPDCADHWGLPWGG